MRNFIFSTRFSLRVWFVLFHPIKTFKHVISGDLDYSKISITQIESLMDNPKVIIEAGAADGVDTLIFSSHFPDAIIYAVEPVKKQFDYLVSKMEDRSNVRLSNIALSNQDKEVEIYIGNQAGNLGGMGSSSLFKPLKHLNYFPEISFEGRQNVQALRLSSYIKSLNIGLVDLLWLDIQGKELDVLQESYEIVTTRVKLLHLEVSRVKLYEGMPTERNIRKFLHNSGFICVIDRVGAISGNALYLNTKLADL